MLPSFLFFCAFIIYEHRYVFLKLFVALYLSSVNFDKLSFYALCMTSIPIFEYACYCLYCRFNYAECRRIKLLDFDLTLFRDMFSFMGWNIYSVGCITGRTQGIAVLLNRYFGVVVNAAYGIAQQVTGQISFLSGSLLNAMQPQIVKAEGSKDRNKMFLLSETTSKFAFFLIGFVTVPTLFYMDEILALWLGIAPDYASDVGRAGDELVKEGEGLCLEEKRRCRLYGGRRERSR